MVNWLVCGAVLNSEVLLQVGLDRTVYCAAQPLLITVQLDLRPPRRVSKVSVNAVQAVDVAMFSSGSFKNQVGSAEERIGEVGPRLPSVWTMPGYSVLGPFCVFQVFLQTAKKIVFAIILLLLFRWWTGSGRRLRCCRCIRRASTGWRWRRGRTRWSVNTNWQPPSL